MTKPDSHLDTLTEIRSLMERSSRFISLSGLSGVFAGIYALIGAGAAYFYLSSRFSLHNYYDYAETARGSINIDFYTFFLTVSLSVLLASLLTGYLLTARKARKKGLKTWDKTAYRMLQSLMIPLVAGGLFCLALFYHGQFGLVAPCTLIFYGLALVNASKYTLNDIKYLGIMEIVLGLISSIFIGYGLLFWAIGFGVLHIIYGTVMYFKYER